MLSRPIRFFEILISRLSLIVLMSICFLSYSAAAALTKKIMKLGNVELTVEVAETPSDLSRGLMERRTLGEDQGMLFIFEEEQILSFWMKNTFIPLSIGFFSKDKILIQTLDMDPPLSLMQRDLPRYQSKLPAKYALEVNKGWFQRKKIVPGQIKAFELRSKGLDK